jgi:hypothetical protein
MIGQTRHWHRVSEGLHNIRENDIKLTTISAKSQPPAHHSIAHPPAQPPKPSIPIPHLRSRRRITRRNRIITPPQPRIIRIIRSRKSHQRTRLPTPTPRNLHLRTRKIHLRAAHTLRLVQRNRLNTHKVLTRGRVFGNRKGNRGFFWPWKSATFRFQ